MMTVSSNKIRILTDKELQDFGLSQENSAQADVKRIEVKNRCGQDYADRRDEYLRGYDECDALYDPIALMESNFSCKLSLRKKLSLPDKKCPNDSIPEF